MAFKNRFPWRLGATSCVLPADIMANVRQLAPLVDDVQLLFFESAAKSRLPQPFDVQALREIAEAHGLSYTVHLPADLALGAAAKVERQEGIGEILRLMAQLAPLGVLSFDLHLVREPDLPEAAWLDNLAASLRELSGALGEQKRLVGVENIEYPFGLVAPLVAEYGFGVCLDLGHLVHYGHDLEEGLGLLSRVRHLHYHGVRGGKDHQGLHDAGQAGMLGRRLAEAGYDGVVTLEMYSLEKLQGSLALLDEGWAGFHHI
ncbi:cobamide remodeling phosphodiesterase CbiR [Thiovibrio frasassiensis]|uniref:Sugar phosphate isomerase/epimerase n=1 Tax=Thiovibrio frasassiensis TaxID=2984131 RepID=A0A9X4MHD5_9BACT|nr:cobamide remodeling phosphodiesterase CbiR [Thiovibrio frasassiensis]MDG4474874.1 sugar phosphate isomerase/epimerase [Thiovibrio frasassiensis]